MDASLKKKGFISFFFPLLWLCKKLSSTQDSHTFLGNYHFLESCRNQPNIWYHNNMVISSTKTGLLWNLDLIYDKTIVLTIWVGSRYLVISPFPHMDLHRQTFRLKAWTTNTWGQGEISLAVSSSKLFPCALKSYEMSETSSLPACYARKDMTCRRLHF